VIGDILCPTGLDMCRGEDIALTLRVV
jgi:hypothetical protein